MSKKKSYFHSKLRGLQCKNSSFNKGPCNAFWKDKIGYPHQAGHCRSHEIDYCIHVDRTGADDDESRDSIIKSYKYKIGSQKQNYQFRSIFTLLKENHDQTYWPDKKIQNYSPKYSIDGVILDISAASDFMTHQ